MMLSLYIQYFITIILVINSIFYIIYKILPRHFLNKTLIFFLKKYKIYKKINFYSKKNIFITSLISCNIDKKCLDFCNSSCSSCIKIKPLSVNKEKKILNK